jgi:hypothetical protein
MSYYEKNRDKLIEKRKLYYQENKETERLKRKLRYQNNREKELLQRKIHYQNNRDDEILRNKLNYEKTKFNPDVHKRNKISDWKRIGVIFFDYDLLYEIYENTSHCDFCNVKLERGRKANSRCLDHDHYITDFCNVRNVLCMTCNKQLPKQPLD